MSVRTQSQKKGRISKRRKVRKAGWMEGMEERVQ